MGEHQDLTKFWRSQNLGGKICKILEPLNPC